MSKKNLTNVEALEAASSIAHLCGGTRSSECLLVALDLKKNATDPQEKARIEKQIKIWQERLVVHNAQPTKIQTYDVKTGLALQS